jgi:hypothetical protein
MEEQNYQNYQPAPPSQSNGMAVAAMVLGICAVIFVFVLWFIGIILAIVGLVLSIMARKQSPSGMATAGLVLNIVALAICAIVVLACTACMASVAPFIRY